MSSKIDLYQMAELGGRFMERVRKGMTFTGSPAQDFSNLCKIVHKEYESDNRLQAAEAQLLRKDFQ